nr:RibD C-terminal domain protein [uncultured bacterium]
MQLPLYSFKKPANRPFIYASFVSTLDGKIIVKEPGYWPIGTANDYEFFTHLRAHADVIVDGKNTALMFGHKTIETIQSDFFKQIRKNLGKESPVEYVVVTSKPNASLLAQFDRGYKPYIATLHSSQHSGYDRSKIIAISGQTHINLSKLMSEFEKRNWHYVFVDGGPTLILALLAENLLDELFITLAPKIFGSKQGKTMTLAEGQLFPPEDIKKFKLISSEVVGDEVFLRYQIQ